MTTLRSMYYYDPILPIITMAKTNKRTSLPSAPGCSCQMGRILFLWSSEGWHLFDAPISPFPDCGLSTKLIPSDLPSWDHFDWSWLWLCVTRGFNWPLSFDARVSAPSSPSVTKDSPFCKEQLPSTKVECISAQLFIASLGGDGAIFRLHESAAWPWGLLWPVMYEWRWRMSPPGRRQHAGCPIFWTDARQCSR